MPTTGYQAAVDSNDLIMSYIAEATWGTTPTTPAFKQIRLDSEGFDGTKSRTRPNEINSTGQASASITTKTESKGNIGFSVSAGTHNDLLAAAVNGVWTTAITFTSGAATCTITSGSDANKTCSLVASDATFTDGADMVIPGQFIKVNGTGTSPYNFIGRVLTVANTTLTLDCCSGTVPVSKTGAEMGATTIKGSCLRNGTTFTSFTFEKKFSATLFLRYTGSMATGGSFDVGVGDYLKGTIDFLNKQQASATGAIAGATYSAAPTGTVVDSVNGIGTVWRGVDTGTTPGVPAAIAGTVQKIGVKFTKEGAAMQYGIGSASAAGARGGKITVTGSLSTYFLTFALFDQFTNEQAGPISFAALDGLASAAATKGYVITYCNATIMNPKIVAGGANQDVMADFEIEGNPDISSTSIFGGKTIQFDYFG